MGKMVICKTCGAKIAKNANVCPNCGANLTFKKPGVIIGLVVWCIAIFLFFKGCSALGGETTHANNDGAATVNSDKIDSPTPSAEAEQSENTVILDKDSVKITYTGMKLTQYLPGQADAYMLTVGLTVENDSDADILVLPMDSSINGVMKMAVSGLPMTVLAGKKSLTGFSFTNLDGTGINSADDIGEVESVEFKLSVLNNSNSSEILKSDTITVTP